MVVVRDAKVETMGVMAELPPDLSPFQIGTTGEWNGRGFLITGRLRVAWEEGSWNEWCITYDATKTGWLSEAQGLLMVSFLTDPGVELFANASDYHAGDRIKIGGEFWTIDGVKQTKCQAGEGELPFVIKQDEERTSVDLTTREGGFGTIELSGEGLEFYLGEYVSFDALKLGNLRPVPGWNAEVAEEKNRTVALACPSCGAAVNLRAAGQTMSAVCGSCGTVIDTSSPTLEIIQEASSNQLSIAQLLPIGQRGKLSGVEYEVIGVVARRDQYSHWSEYLLFNPWQGFRWLVYYAGHWTLVTLLPAMPDVTSNRFTKNGHDYRLFARGRAEVTGVLGEFYWKVRRGEKADVSDYVSPPFILSKEAYPDLDEFTWSQGVYIKPKVLQEAFNVKNLPEPQGTYLNEPNPYEKRWGEIKWAFMIAMGLLVLIEIFFAATRPAVEVTAARFVFDRSKIPLTPLPAAAASTALPQPSPAPGAATSGTFSPQSENVFLTPHFLIEKHQEKLVIDGAANVDNSWLDLDMDLVNAKTNVTYPAEMEISYYHGYDDGNWSEGSQGSSASIAGVPPGEYFLSVEPDADPGISNMPFTVKVQRGGIFTSNFLMSLFVVAFYPLYLLGRKYAFERARWAESDYSYKS
jgi:hypothetical protein